VTGRPLIETLTACGPVVDEFVATRAWDRLFGAAREAGWAENLARAWPALAPIFSASPYLSGLAGRDPDCLRRCLEMDPQAHLAQLIETTNTCGALTGTSAERGLRALKRKVHLLTALADLGGVWDLDGVTGALSRFADAAVRAAFEITAREARDAGRVTALGEGESGPIPGLFCIAMGKLGGDELNYSCDIDLTLFHESAALPLAAGAGAEPSVFVARCVQRIVALLQRRTADGYVFRVDLRLRPDPSSTPAVVSVAAAFQYYETVGQNWERAALIKARVVCGDQVLGTRFLQGLQPFIWRRHLDFAAIADIHAIKRQINAHQVDDRLSAAGADLKLGRGGIREIEFFVQTQQLILGGRQPTLRSPRTLDALAALAEAGHVRADAAEEMGEAYRSLRALEHRVQMIGDEQTHRLPQAAAQRRPIAALAGYETLRAFDAAVGKLLKGVNQRYAALFAGEEPLASRFGSLVFTGVEDDPETLATLRRMGFTRPGDISATIRGWHHGHIAPARSERGRELLTRLTPRLLDSIAATGAPDVAFQRFTEFFIALRAGVQIQSLFLAQPRLLSLVVRMMAFAPRFARALARRPAALDALLDPGFLGELESPATIAAILAATEDLETAMNVARRLGAEGALRIAVQLLGETTDAEAAGRAFTTLADGLIQGLADASLADLNEVAGSFPGEVAVIALGKCGSAEMSATSDLDLMTLYDPGPAGAASSRKGLSAESFYARFTQKLVAALSAPTAEGDLYAVDLQLRPSGGKGPVAVSTPAFEAYYARDAETWELLALTRARVVWASSAVFGADARLKLELALRRPRAQARLAKDVRDMRALLKRERPPWGVWDMKRAPGGLVDIEFAAQYLQLAGASKGGPLNQNTGAALQAIIGDGPDLAPDLETLLEAWRLQQALSQMLKIALQPKASPESEPASFRRLLAKVGGARDFAALKRTLSRSRAGAEAAVIRVLSPDAFQP
jgi:glutamate-ammonia-ligase adenylyltransferase